jgi:hypothetical protein
MQNSLSHCPTGAAAKTTRTVQLCHVEQLHIFELKALAAHADSPAAVVLDGAARSSNLQQLVALLQARSRRLHVMIPPNNSC